jgi:acyl-CoA thioesterase-1
VKIVTMGDSITKGVRKGVKADETFSALLQARLKERGSTAEVVNAGVENERTDQALARLESAVLSRRPSIVVIMYGTDDSYVARDARASQIDLDTFSRNLRALVDRLRERNVTPVLMTPPRWADDVDPNGRGEHPNFRLEAYVRICRDVARSARVTLVDNYADWSDAARRGTNIRDWTTDGRHPNPEGHRRIAALLQPVVSRLVTP